MDPSRPASSERSDPATRAPRARRIEAKGNIPLPPIPQKKYVELLIVAALWVCGLACNWGDR